MSRSPIMLGLVCAALVASLASSAAAQAPGPDPQTFAGGEELVQLDFADVELTAVIETIAKITGKNFIYDDRVRGRVTIVSPSKITVDQAYAVFESVLKVKGFTTVQGPGGVLKVIPVRDAKESNIETIRGGTSPNRDTFVTRLIPLRYIDAESIANTIKPLVSKDAAMVSYPPTNTIILTDTQANIRRLLSILESIDVETHKEELAVIKIEHADASNLAQQISEIFGAEISSGAAATSRTRTSRRSTRTTTPTPGTTGRRGGVRIITDERTNSMLVLASRALLDDVRGLVRKLDVPVTGGGRIHVYYLKHSDAEELAQTLNGLLSGQRGAPGGGVTGAAGQPQAMRSAITALSSGITVTADPATNALVIQASKEAYDTLREVIEMLDISRPQVLVEALILEVIVQDSRQLGINFITRFTRGDSVYTFESLPSSGGPSLLADAATGFLTGGPFGAGAPLLASFVRNKDDSSIAAIIRASASDGDVNIVSAPHILTSDNEEAEIRVGNNIPIITSRVSSAQTSAVNNQATSVNVERQDVGVTLRVTPQISEGDTVRLKIFQEITQVNETLTETTGSAEDVGVSLTNRRIENTVVVDDGQTVVIGGLLEDTYEERVTKVPFLGDIPILGWLFKEKSEGVRQINLLVFLTPHIIRNAADLEAQTIRKRLELEENAKGEANYRDAEKESMPVTGNPVMKNLNKLAQSYPLERMREIEMDQEAERVELLELARTRATTRYIVRSEAFRDDLAASKKLTDIIDGGFDATLVSGESGGVVAFEIQVGPFDRLLEAQRAAEILNQAHGVPSSVTVIQVSEP